MADRAKLTDPIQPISHRAVTLTDWVSAGFAYLGVYGLRLLPFSVASGLGGFLASTFGPMLKKSNIARRNLKAAFPEKSSAEIEIIVRGVWDNMGRTAFEFPLMPRLLSGSQAHRLQIDGYENVKSALKNGKPVLFFGGHFGNWETPPLAASVLGFQVNSFYRAPNNPLLLNLFSSRTTPGELIPKGPAGAKRAFTLLKKGQNIGMLVDQKLNDGLAIPLLGRDAMTGPAIAEFARRFDAPLIPFRCVRLPGAKFQVSFLPPLPVTKSDDRKADVLATMTDINATLEDWIRQYPDQWLWLHNRWPN